MTIPDFSDLYSPADSLTTDKPVTPQKSGGLPEFNDLYAPAAIDNRKLRVSEANAAKDDFYNRIGLKPGALRGFVDLLPSAYLSAMGITGSDVSDGFKQALTGVSGLASNLVENPLSTSGNLAKGVVEGIVKPFVQYPLELITNKQIDMSTDLTKLDAQPSLTPEEREQRARGTGANVIGWALGLKAEEAISSHLIGQEAILGGKGLKRVSESIQAASKVGILSDERVVGDVVDQAFSQYPTRDLMKLRDAAVAPDFVRRVAGGIGGGGVGGFSTGYLEGDTSADRLAGGLSYAMVAMPMGVAMTSIGALAKLNKATKVADMPDMIGMQASNIAKLRMINASADQTAAEILFNINNLDITQSMAATLALKNIHYESIGVDKGGVPMQYGMNASIIPGVENPSEIMRIVAEHNAEERRAIAVTHVSKDGVTDVMVAPVDMPKVEQDFFSKTGFMHGQQVSFGGRDQWVIESQGRVDGKRGIRMTLRDLVTDERVEDVRAKQLTRLSSQEPGDLALHLGRFVTLDDIFDPAQGFARGRNFLDKDSKTYNDIHVWRQLVDAHAFDLTGAEVKYTFEEGNGVAAKELNRLDQLTKLRKLTDEEDAHYEQLQSELNAPRTVKSISIGGQEMKPGINHIMREQDGLKKGLIVYVGGAEEKALVPDSNGRPTEQKVTVGNPNEVVAVLDWSEEQGHNGRVIKGSQNFFSYLPAPNRAIATAALKKMRIDLGLTRSLSSLNEGSGTALMNALNVHQRDRAVRSNLTVMSPEAIKTHLIESFLDHIGATPDGNILISKDQAIAYTGLADDSGLHPENIIANRGESAETMLGRMQSDRIKYLNSQYEPKLFTESFKPLTIEETRKLFESQLTSDAIPTVRTEMDRAIDRTQVSFNDLVTSYMAANGIRPEASPAVRGFLEDQIGKSLLGLDNARGRLADRSVLPVLKGEIERINRNIAKIESRLNSKEDQYAPNERVFYDGKGHQGAPSEHIAKLKETKDVFEARIKQIENAEPLPFTDEEKKVYSRLMTEAQSIRRKNAEDLAATAMSNGFAVENEKGVITLRDAQTWQKLPQQFADAESARDFINATGKSKGIDVDGGANNLVPPSSVASVGMLPPPPPPRLFEVPYQFAPDTRVSKVMTFLDSVAPWFTPKRAFMVAMDNTFKTRFYSDVYLPLQTAKMKVEAMKRPFLQLTKDIEDHLLKNNIPRDRWSTITQYRESMSPQQIVDNLFSDRKLTQAEINYAGRLHKDNIDIQNVFSYRRAAAEMTRQYTHEKLDLQNKMQSTQDMAQQLGYKQLISQLDKQHLKDIEGAKDVFNMDDKHLAAATMFDEIAKRPINEASLHGVTRLAQALQNNEGTREEFAASKNMTPAEMKAGKMVDAAYSAVAKHLNIDERLTNYFNHFRSFSELPDATPANLQKAVLRGAINEMPKLAQEMIRSGEMNAYELDPIKALTQYISTSFNNRHFNDTWKTARNAAVDGLKQITKGREAAAKVLNEYIGGMKNVPAASDQLGQVALDNFMTSMGFDARPDIKSGIANTFLAASSGSMLGFRPAQGIRDFVQFAKIYYSRFGASRFNNGLKLAYERDANGMRMIEKLALEGTVPGLSILQFASEDELANGIAGKAGRVKDAIFAASEKGLKLSGQHNAYALSHAIAYLDTRALAKDNLLKLSRGEITKESAYKRLGMNSYDLPVAQGFDKLVSAGKMNEATEYLAQSTGAETAFVFGLQNHPLGWGTAIGKLAAQFGTWSVWGRNYLTRLAGRGTASERAASMARFAASEVATLGVGKVTGFDMRSWYMLPGIAFLGGPAYEYLQQLEDVAGMRGAQRQALAQKQLMRGPIPVIGQFVPGNSALNDYWQAYQLSQKRYGPLPILGRGLGFAVDQSGRSLVDEMMGLHPETFSH